MCRIDKYLWAVRLHKTRSQAAQACKDQHIRVDGQVVKSSKIVKTGEILEHYRFPIWRKYRILQLSENRLNAKLVEEYLQEITEASELEKLEHFRNKDFDKISFS